MEGAVPMAGLTLIGLYCLVRAVLAWPSNMLASLAPVGLVAVGCGVFLVWACFFAGSGGVAAKFHGHGDTRTRAWNHEKRHKRALSALKIRVDRIRVWAVAGGWAGETVINKSASNVARWDALSPVQQAAVYMAGAMGPEGNYGCADDLAEVDTRTSRGAARREAAKYL